ncbi:hypothetical protein [Desulfovibrio inopinatus]|uniref:hypothetical protein n=1 Tax=Desulfovibrio inopinatus TaxID=102109 RepID=UPI00041BE76E|nr:hypothetical protein [Desulfovibrio inopinatus]
MMRKGKVDLVFHGRLFILLVMSVSLVLIAASHAKASLYLTGTARAGLFTSVRSGGSFDTSSEPLPRGIVTEINKETSASAGTGGNRATSSAHLQYSVNADSLGWIKGDTVGEFSISMTGSVLRPYGPSYAISNDDFAIQFNTTVDYEYNISSSFRSYYNGSGHVALKELDEMTDIYSAISDGDHTETGLSTGIIPAGSYEFSSSLLLSIFSPSGDGLDANLVNATLTLSPVAPSAVPLPGSLLLLSTGLIPVCVLRRKFFG